MPPVVAGWRAMYSRDPVTGDLYGIGVPAPPSPFVADGVEPAVLPVDFIWGDTSQVVPVGTVVASLDQLSDVDTTTAVPAIGDTLVWDGTNWVPVTPTTTALSVKYDATFVNSFAGTMDFHVSAQIVTMRMTNVSRTGDSAMGVQTKICDFPVGVPAPPDVLAGYRTTVKPRMSTSGLSSTAQHLSAMIHIDGTSVYVIPTGGVMTSGWFLDTTLTWAR